MHPPQRHVLFEQPDQQTDFKIKKRRPGMTLKRCDEDKHFYNPETHDECPICKEDRQRADKASHAPPGGRPRANAAVSDPPASKGAAPAPPSPAIGTDKIKEQTPGIRGRRGVLPTVPVSRPAPPGEPDRGKSAGNADENPFLDPPPLPKPPGTRIIHSDNTEAFLDHLPTVGWLVIVDGPGPGRDFRLIQGENRIGRDPSMEVCLDIGAQSDQSVSREAHAIVVYDPNANEFFIERGRSRNLPLLNGATIRRDQNLATRDIIRVGCTSLLFFALCDESFRW
jgi:hypothetical protein